MPTPTTESTLTALDHANRARRFYAAERRLRRILAVEPALTPQQRRDLAALLLADLDGEDGQ